MNFLENILKEKQDCIAQKKKVLPQNKLIDKLKGHLKPSEFKHILEIPGTHLIAEIKRASPSKGDLRPDLDVIQIANIYRQQGVQLVSVIVEEKFFKGSLSDLLTVKLDTGLSLLCKDFVMDSYQIYEAKIYGADAILLIVAILSLEQLKEFICIAKELKMDSVVEVHNEDELNTVLKLGLGVEIIGINHRNLRDFSLDLKITEQLLPDIPEEKIVIAESGIASTLQIRKFRELGVNAILVGESLLREKDIARKVRELMDALG